jgi:hypothetical protein
MGREVPAAGRANIRLRQQDLSSSPPDAHLVESELMKLLVDECLGEDLQTWLRDEVTQRLLTSLGSENADGTGS